MRVFSSVVALGRTLVIWYERAMPFCEIQSGESPVISPPLNKIRPDEGRNTPVTQLKKVLLPAPFGPIIARISPRSTAKLIRFSAVCPPKRTVRSSVRNSGADAPGKDSSETYSNAADIVLIQFHDGDNRLWTIISPPICVSVVMFSGRGEMAGWRHQRLVPRDGLLDMIDAILDDIDQLGHEVLMGRPSSSGRARHRRSCAVRGCRAADRTPANSGRCRQSPRFCCPSPAAGSRGRGGRGAR